MRLTTNYILLIEDDTDDIEMSRWILDEADEEILIANTGKEGLDYIFPPHQNPLVSISCVLLDLNLPKMKGEEVLEIIRSKFTKQDLPVYVFIASHHEIDYMRDRLKEANGYIIKPLTRRVWNNIYQSL